MLNKTENNTNISSINPCSTESLIAVTGNDGETHIIQRELISHSVEGHEATIIHLVTGKSIRVYQNQCRAFWRGWPIPGEFLHGNALFSFHA